MEIPDNTLFLQIAGNDYLSFNILFHRYYSRLCAFVFEIIRDPEVAEDIVQEFYMKLWTQRSDLKIKGNARSYLFSACRNAALNFVRDENTRRKNTQTATVTSMSDEEIPNMEDYLDALEKCIEKLPERSKQVFLMHKFEDYSQKEISEKLNISVKTIKNQIWKSLQYLRECLDPMDR